MFGFIHKQTFFSTYPKKLSTVIHTLFLYIRCIKVTRLHKNNRVFSVFYEIKIYNSKPSDQTNRLWSYIQPRKMLPAICSCTQPIGNRETKDSNVLMISNP